MDTGAYGGGKAGGSFDPLAFVQRPIVVLRSLCWVNEQKTQIKIFHFPPHIRRTHIDYHKIDFSHLSDCVKNMKKILEDSWMKRIKSEKN